MEGGCVRRAIRHSYSHSYFGKDANVSSLTSPLLKACSASLPQLKYSSLSSGEGEDTNSLENTSATESKSKSVDNLLEKKLCPPFVSQCEPKRIRRRSYPQACCEVETPVQPFNCQTTAGVVDQHSRG